jgi:hypothetical protein
MESKFTDVRLYGAYSGKSQPRVTGRYAKDGTLLMCGDEISVIYDVPPDSSNGWMGSFATYEGVIDRIDEVLNMDGQLVNTGVTIFTIVEEGTRNVIEYLNSIKPEDITFIARGGQNV